MLSESGHEVYLVGPSPAVLKEPCGIARFVVPAFGTGALYSPSRIDSRAFLGVLWYVKPDLVLCEAWQTALTDSAVILAKRQSFPACVISHGVSLHPFSLSPLEILRWIAWIPYRIFSFPRLIRSLKYLCVLDLNSSSHRFFDRDLALRAGKSVRLLPNCPINATSGYILRQDRKKVVLVIGYFSRIKNQLGALRTAELFLSAYPDFSFIFVGEKSGKYFERCKKRISSMVASDSISVYDDSECDIKTLLPSSFCVLMPSLTEALPVTLLEAMHCGTPFVASPVGAIPALLGGITAAEPGGQADGLRRLVRDSAMWTRLSEAGRRQCAVSFSQGAVKSGLTELVDLFGLHADRK